MSRRNWGKSEISRTSVIKVNRVSCANGGVMWNQVLRMLAIVVAACPVAGLAQAPKDAVYISDEDVKAVLKHAVDRCCQPAALIR
jgi:hypothetical protein